MGECKECWRLVEMRSRTLIVPYFDGFNRFEVALLAAYCSNCGRHHGGWLIQWVDFIVLDTEYREVFRSRMVHIEKDGRINKAIQEAVQGLSDKEVK